MSHHATEDLAVLRAIPNVTLVAPGDPAETAAATRLVHETPGTCYLRLGRGGEPAVHETATVELKLGKAIQVLAGGDVVLISMGGMLKNTFEAAKKLGERGLSVAIYSMPTLKPVDADLIRTVAREARLIVTVEEHNVIGGLGSAVAEILAQHPSPRARLRILGIEDFFPSVVGDQGYLRALCGLSVEGIVNAVLAGEARQ
jgi:transketolase